MPLRSQALRVYKYAKIQRPRFLRNSIMARYRKSDLHGTSFQSCIAENKSHAHPKTHLHTVKTITILLIQILIFFRPLSSVHLLQSNQRFQAIEFEDRHISEKL